MATKVKTNLTKLKGMRKDWKTTGKALKTINPKIKNVDKWAKGSFNYQAREANTGKFSPAQFTHPRRSQPTPVEQFGSKDYSKVLAYYKKTRPSRTTARTYMQKWNGGIYGKAASEGRAEYGPPGHGPTRTSFRKHEKKRIMKVMDKLDSRASQERSEVGGKLKITGDRQRKVMKYAKNKGFRLPKE